MPSISIVCAVMRASIATHCGQDYTGFVPPAADTTETLEEVSTHMQRRQMLSITYQAPSEAEPSLCRVFEAPAAFTVKPFTRPEMPHTSVQALGRTDTRRKRVATFIYMAISAIAKDKQSSNNNSGKHTNSEFASMMDSCKSQVRNLQDATKNPDNKAKRIAPKQG
ncbi:hypothetical protein BX661DRAFT_201210 [Kickxella alabastrina]|uniref:uncharacterized protein n=1 Tax=Kickxella alabastrina TaxID=61397 RepID=UPI00221EE2C9|nr:uncharacterized protein BX661DRAFT_201210 [Kickxella alabastrina]KAI7819758.1 hypothetical protein BX661DRAFT_201210 [Kickxella alabastrina]